MAPGETAEQAQRRREEQAEKRRLAVERQAARNAARNDARRAEQAEERRRAEQAEERCRAEQAEERRRAEQAEERRAARNAARNAARIAARRAEQAEERRRAEQAEERRRAEQAEERRRAEQAEERRLAVEREAARNAAAASRSASLSSLNPVPSPASTSGAVQATQPVVTEAESTDNQAPVTVNITVSCSIVAASPATASPAAASPAAASPAAALQTNNDNIIKSKQATVDPEGSHSKDRVSWQRSTREPSQFTSTTTTTVGTGIASITNTKKQDAPASPAAQTQRASTEAGYNTSSPPDPPSSTSVFPSQDSPLSTAPRGFEEPPASSGDTATSAPNQVVTSAQSLERDQMDDDDDEEDGDYEDESKEDEELRQGPVKVIAERRHRERLHQDRQEAAAYEQRCRAGQERVQQWRRKKLLCWGPMLVAFSVVWLSMALAGGKPLLVSFPQLKRWIWQKQCELLWEGKGNVSKQVTSAFTCFLDSESFSVNQGINLDFEQGHAVTAMNPQWSEGGQDEMLRPDHEQMEPNHTIESNTWLAFHPEMSLDNPRSYYYGRLVFGFIFFAMAMISVALTALWEVVQYLVVFYLNAFAASPWTVGLTSIFVVGLSSSIYRRYKERAQRQKRQEQVLFVRNQVHLRLQHQAAQAAAQSDTGDENMDDQKSAAVELSSKWLCQDLAWKLYPTSRRDRQMFMTQIWPHVVRDVSEDGRIGKKGRVGEESEVSANDGRQRRRVVEYWTWLPPVSTLHTDSHVVAKTVAAQY